MFVNAYTVNFSVRILMVGMENSSIPIYREGLIDMGYTVDVGHAYKQVAAGYREGDYDVILIDVTNSYSDGLSLLKNLKREGYKGSILLLANQGTPEMINQGLEFGADNFIVLPLKIEELSMFIRANVRRQSSLWGRYLKLGETLHVDTQSLCVYVEGHKFFLSKQEYTVLVSLLRNRGGIVSRRYLYNRLKGEEGHDMTNLLNVIVCSLRNKIGTEVVQTIRGKGYKVMSCGV